MAAVHTLPLETRLLLRLVRPAQDADDRAALRAQLQRPDVDWPALAGQAVRHGVAAPCYHTLRAHFAGCVPPEALEHLRQRFHARLRRSLFLLGALPGVLRILSERGIETAVFKGPVLAVRAYGDVQLRPFTDLDLLIRKRDVPAAVAALQAAGYAEANPLPADYDTHWTSYWPLLHHPHGNANGYHRPDGVALDLHWGLASRYFLYPQDPEALWPRMIAAELPGGPAVKTFGPEDALLFLCMHAAKHHWTELRFACDIAAHLHAHPALDWGWTFAQARALRSTRMMMLGVHLARTLLGAPVPPRARRRIEAQPEVRATARRARAMLFSRADTLGTLQVLAFHLRVRDRRRDALGTCLYTLPLALRPTPADRAWIALPPALSFLYGALRPARILWMTLFRTESRR